MIETVVVTTETVEISNPATTNVETLSVTTESITVTAPPASSFTIEISEVGSQGAQGPQGPAGASAPKGPAFTYTSGVLTRIDYDDGAYKVFTYTSGKLTQLDFVVGSVTTRKTFNYSGDTLTSIDEVTL